MLGIFYDICRLLLFSPENSFMNPSKYYKQFKLDPDQVRQNLIRSGSKLFAKFHSRESQDNCGVNLHQVTFLYFVASFGNQIQAESLTLWLLFIC